MNAREGERAVDLGEECHSLLGPFFLRCEQRLYG